MSSPKAEEADDQIVEQLEQEAFPIEEPHAGSDTLDTERLTISTTPQEHVEISTAIMDSIIKNVISDTGPVSNLIQSVKEVEKFKEDITRMVGNVDQQSEWSFICSTCNEQITITHPKLVFSVLQSHRHVEQGYVTFISARSSLSPLPHMEIRILQEPESEIPPPRVELDEFNNFRFNFHEKIHSVLYPANLMDIIAELNEPNNILQDRVDGEVYCLLCRTPVDATTEGAVASHLQNTLHVQKKTPDRLNAVVDYHDMWKSYDLLVQWHQVEFVPESRKVVFCELCSVEVNYEKIEEHLREQQHELACMSKLRCFKKIVREMLMKLYATKKEVSETGASGSQASGRTAGTALFCRKYWHFILRSQHSQR